MSVCSPSKRPPHKPLPVEIPALDTEEQPCLPGVVHWHLQEPDLLCPALGYLMPKLA